MPNVHQSIWWQLGLKWFFTRIGSFAHFVHLAWSMGLEKNLTNFAFHHLWKISLRELKKKVYKLAKIFSVWPAAVPGGWSNRLGSWNWQQNSFWDFQSLTCLTTEQIDLHKAKGCKVSQLWLVNCPNDDLCIVILISVFLNPSDGEI